MIFDFPRSFPPDAVERAVPDLASARALGGVRLRVLDEALARRRAELSAHIANAATSGDLFARCEAVITIAYARLALRHGRWGDDFHAYHNEEHILEIFRDRIERLIETHGVRALALREWCVLGMFAACHDLRQREDSLFEAGVGANERASLEETFRLLDEVGFSREADADFYRALDLTIAGSTFDARPPPGEIAFNAAELVQSGGALAAKLAQKLDKHRPGWRSETNVVRAHELALISADLDTANVAEPFERFATSAANLCREREMLCARDLDAAESARPVLGFLTDGQDRFFFDLHRFNSELGRSTFEAAKSVNAPRLKALTLGLRMRIERDGEPVSGRQVLERYCQTVSAIA